MRRTLIALTALVTTSACFEDEAFPPHFGVYLGIMFGAQVEGVLQPGMPAANLTLIRPFVAGPQLQPDFLSGNQPPFCMGFRFGPTSPPNVVNGDAGTITMSGFTPVDYMDMTQGFTPGPQTTMSDPITCSIQEVGSTAPYVCNVPSVVMQAAPPGTTWIDNDSRMRISFSGGENVGEFEEVGIQPAPAAVASAAFPLNQIDPSDVTAMWEPVDAAMVMIEMIAQLSDGSAGAQVLCLEPAQSGLKVIPPEALALLPTPTGPNQLFIQTHLVALNIRQGSKGWGGYMVGAGRGQVGISCRISSGNCPPP